MFWDNLFAAASNHVAAAKRSLVIAAPFVKVGALKAIFEVVPENIEILIYTRWRPEEVARGVSDTAILPLVESRAGSVWLCDTLHAKIFLVDYEYALIGSANVTAAGLGLSKSPNFEILTPLSIETAVAAQFLRDLHERSRQATPEIAKSVIAAAAAFQIPDVLLDPDSDNEIVEYPRRWVPRFRSPDRLFDLYADPDWRSSVKPNDLALLDLLGMQVPRSLDRKAFELHVRERVLMSPAVLAIDAMLTEPQRFGALTDALRNFDPELSHADRQNLLQISLRWMLYFASDIYELSSPKYSEIVSKR
jgi:hypothetical protein